MGEGSVQDEAHSSSQGRDSRAAMILDQGEGADLGKMPKPVWDLVDVEYPEGDSRGASASGLSMSKGQITKSLD